MLHLGRESGLSNNYVMGIAQDRNGFIWVSTESGLNRCDGSGFTPFKSAPGSISADELNRIVMDSEKNVLWICTQRNGLDALDCDTYQFTHYKDGQGSDCLASTGITDVAPDADGIVWISTYTSGLDRLDTRTGEVSHFNSSTVKGWTDDKLWTVKLSADGTKIYLGHVDNGFSIFDPSKNQIRNYLHKDNDRNSLPGNSVRDILVDNYGNVWIGTDKGLALFNPAKEEFTSFRHNPDEEDSLIADMIYHLGCSSDGKLWISTENGGISVLNINDAFLQSPSNIRFTNYTTSTQETVALSNKTIHATFEDIYGNIWIGTHGDGLDIICHRPKPITRIHTESRNSRISDNSVMSLNIKGDSMFVGTDSKGVDMFIKGKFIGNINSGNSPLGDNAVLSLAQSRNGDLWIGTYGGDVMIRKKDGSFHKINIPGSIDVRNFAENKDGSMIVATGRGPAIVHPDGRIRTIWEEKCHDTDEWLRTLLIRNNGDIWIGSFGNGIAIYDNNFNLKRRLYIGEQLLSNTIHHLIEHRGHIWAATGKGLAKLDEKGTAIKVYTKEDGLPDNVVLSLMSDSEKRLWISTGKGLSRLDADSRISNYNAGYGLDGADFYGASVAADSIGNIFFGTHSGLYSFNPDALTLKTAIPAPRITGICIYGNQRDNSDKEIFSIPENLTLSHSQNTLLVKFGLTDAAEAPLVEWSYRLEGINDRWIPASAQNGILLSNLPSGKYNLLIKASVPNQKEDAIVSLPFKVNPPFWASTWAWILYVLIFLLLIFYWMRFYRKRLSLEYTLNLERDKSSREHEMIAERMRFFTNITHELRTPLTLIIGPLDDLKNDTALPATHRKKVGMIHNSASRLLDLINTILEFRKTETRNRNLKVEYGDISGVVSDIGMRYSVLNTNPQLIVNTEIEPGNYELWFDRETMNIIIDNLMSNACKYTVEGSVTLGLSHTSEDDVPFTEISVRDTGLGIEPDTLPHIFDRYYRGKKSSKRLGTGIGLALVYNLVKLHQGEIFVESEQGKGSVFRVRIGTGNTYPEASRESSTPQSEPETAGKEIESKSEKLHVLVVDDNIDIINYISDCLEEDYIISTATDGKKGLQSALTDTPDFIVTDIMMPNMDGMTFIRHLKSNPKTNFIPVLIVTAKVSEEARTKAYDCGADSFITKPFSSKVLRSRIRNIITLRQSIARKEVENRLSLPDSAGIPASSSAAKVAGNDDTGENNLLVTALTESDKEFIDKILEIIDKNIAGSKLDVKSIADSMNMSHSTLYRKVKSVTGFSVSGLIRKCRARKGAELIRTGKYTVSEVAFMVGLENLGNFRQCFKEEFGVNPSELIRSIQNKNI